MTKPAVTLKNVKTTPLTQAELDTNFENLRDATIGIQAGTGGTTVTADLNGVITLVAGSGVTFTGDNGAKTITVTASGGSNLTSNLLQVGSNNGNNTVIDSRSNYLIIRSGVETIGQDTLAQITLSPLGDIRFEANALEPKISFAADLVHFLPWQQEGTSVLFMPLLRVPRAASTAEFSISPIGGEIFFDTSTNKFRGYNGSGWVDLN